MEVIENYGVNVKLISHFEIEILYKIFKYDRYNWKEGIDVRDSNIRMDLSEVR
jgi:hypothetical protein